ncbi:tetratricopeptide repeat protein [Pseudobacillus badius]|uniref:tetratricopeptide repeat protein n=1 Tax=Bacillus badius TaxID=1455 RepID=UPI000A56D49B|nr:tetratricopeptide repeat protein [Bacillus badius]TDW02762.1 LuxR family maltose regulon positive regulatory protein [Bacillus badius]
MTIRSMRMPQTESLMDRKQLFSLLLSRPHKKIATVVAGAGYGKTSLLTAFFHKYPMLGGWVTLTQPVYTFDQLAGLLPSVTGKEPFWIVVDQSENLKLDEPETSRLVAWVEQLPFSVTLVLSGRKIPKKLPVSRWKVRGLAVAIDQKNLAFTLEETSQLLDTVYKINLTSQEVRHLLTVLEGWPAGLMLFNEAVTGANLDSGLKHFLNRFYLNEDVHQYVASEVMADLPADVQTFLLHASLFRELDEGLLSLYKPDWPIRDYIENIRHIQPFLLVDEPGRFRIHELFRRLFYQLAEREWGGEKVKHRHGELAILCRANYRFFEAILQALAAGNDRLVAGIMKDIAERYEPEEFLRLIDGWLEQLSPSLHLSRTSLLLFRCIPVELAKQLIAPLELIAHRYKNEVSPGYADLYHRLATIYFYQGELTKAVQLYEASLELSYKNEDEPMAALNTSLLAQMYRFMNDTEKAFVLSRRALAKAEAHGFKQVQMHALWNAAELLIEKGHLEKARRLAEQSIHVARECDESSIIYPLCTISSYFRAKGELEEALQWAHKALEQADGLGIRPDRGWASAAVALCYQELGNLREARRLMEEAARLFKGFRHHSCIIQKKLTLILSKQGHMEEAYALQKEVDSIARESSYTWLQKKEKIDNKPLLSLQMLGPLSIRLGEEPIQIKRKSSLRLLLLLASGSKRRWSRDELIGRLFPEETEEAASNQFYVGLSTLRKLLEPDLKKGRNSRFIAYDGSHYYFRFEEVKIDVEELKQLLLYPYSPEVFAQASRLYKGDLLHEYLYEEWLEESRAMIRKQYLKALEKWAAQCQEEGKIKEAAEILEVMVALEPYEESFQMHYVRLLLKNGKLGKARKSADNAIMLMEKELGLSMKEEFNQLFYLQEYKSVRLE